LIVAQIAFMPNYIADKNKTFVILL